MMSLVAMIGFGEAASAFASEAPDPTRFRAFDIKTADPCTAPAKRADYARAGIIGCESVAEALDGAAAVLSLVTADQALSAARNAAPLLATGALWLDMNSAAPGTKQAAAAAVEAARGRYVDVAVMAPVHPARVGTPLLLSGPYAEQGAALLRSLGFANVHVVPGGVGRASAIKMIRSVIVKGVEALTAECVLAAAQAGVLDEVLASLDGSPQPATWHERADYNLDRMMVHGLRRAAEMEEAVKILDALGTSSVMTRGTIEHQRAIGNLGMTRPPAGLLDKLAVLAGGKEVDAA